MKDATQIDKIGEEIEQRKIEKLQNRNAPQCTTQEHSECKQITIT